MTARCIVVRDQYGSTHADQLSPDENPLDAAKDLVLRYGLGDDETERFVFGVVDAEDPGIARLMPSSAWVTHGFFNGFETRELPGREAFEVKGGE